MELNHTPLPNKSLESSYHNDSLASSGTSKVRSESLEQRPSGKLHLGELKEGQRLKGEVIDLRYQEVKIRLEPSQQIITAKIANDTPLSIGQEAQFEVTEVNENQLVLKFASQETNVYDSTIQKALQASSLPMTARNKSIVAELLKHQLPIDKQTIHNLIRATTINKDISIEVIITAFRHKVPLSKENLTQLNSYLQGDSSFHPDNKELAQELIYALKQVFTNDKNGAGGVHKGGHLMTDSSHSPMNDIPTNLIDSLLPYTLAVAKQEDILSSIFHGRSLDLLSQSLQHHIKSDSQGSSEEAIYNQILAGSADIVDTMDFIKTTLQDANSLELVRNLLLDTHISEEDKEILHPLLERLYERAEQLHQFRESTLLTLSNLLQLPVSKSSLPWVLGERGDDLHTILERQLNQRFSLDSDELKKQNSIPTFYRRMREDIDSITALVRSSHHLQESDPLPSLIKETSDGLQMMKTMNDIFQFLAIPLQSQKTEGKGELYVYRKKTALNNRQDSLNVFMHLDMVHLGSLDIQLLLQTEPSLSINARFYTENDSTGNLIQTNLQHLSNQLQKIGYHFQGHVQWDKPLSKPLVDLLDDNSFDMSHGRYTFDIRA